MTTGRRKRGWTSLIFMLSAFAVVASLYAKGEIPGIRIIGHFRAVVPSGLEPKGAPDAQRGHWDPEGIAVLALNDGPDDLKNGRTNFERVRYVLEQAQAARARGLIIDVALPVADAPLTKDDESLIAELATSTIPVVLPRMLSVKTRETDGKVVPLMTSYDGKDLGDARWATPYLSGVAGTSDRYSEALTTVDGKILTTLVYEGARLFGLRRDPVVAVSDLAILRSVPIQIEEQSEKGYTVREIDVDDLEVLAPQISNHVWLLGSRTGLGLTNRVFDTHRLSDGKVLSGTILTAWAILTATERSPLDWPASTIRAIVISIAIILFAAMLRIDDRSDNFVVETALVFVVCAVPYFVVVHVATALGFEGWHFGDVILEATFVAVAALVLHVLLGVLAKLGTAVFGSTVFSIGVMGLVALAAGRAEAEMRTLSGIDPPGATVFIGIEDSYLFQARKGDKLSPQEVAVARDGVVLTCRLPDGEEVFCREPYSKSAFDKLWMRLTWATRLSVLPAIRMGPESCAAVPDLARFDIPVAAGGTKQKLAAGARALVVPIRSAAGKVTAQIRGPDGDVIVETWSDDRILRFPTTVLSPGLHRLEMTTQAVEGRLLTLEVVPTAALPRIPAADPVLSVVFLATTEHPVWRLEALQALLSSSPLSEDLRAFGSTLAQGIDLDATATELAACLGRN